MGSATRFLLLLTPSPLLHHRCPSLIRLTRHHNRLSPSLCSLFHHLNHPLSTSHSPPLCPTTSAAASGNKNTRFLSVKCSSRQLHVQTSSLSHSPTPPRISHPWPEFHALLDYVSATGYFSWKNGNDEFVAFPDLMEDFTRSASACLSFARDRPNLLGMLSRNDIKVVVENGTPFLFKDGEESVRRMKSFLENHVLDTDKATTADLMKFLLSYASNIFTSLEANNLYNRQLVESSVRNLLGELAKLSGSMQNQFPDRYGQTRAPFGQNIEMKRGDWICPRCSFMNFARNMKCLECEEARPKRQLTGGEWECPQCCFHNYRKNIVCLRCDCKRPGDVSLGNSPNSGSVLDQGHWDYSNKSDIDRKLAENEEKAQRWFSKISQMDSTSDMNSVIEDEDFPEIMPLRKGVNRFVVSTRKTPLERRLANAQYRRNLGNDGTPEATNDNTLGEKVSHTLDNILGRTSASSDQNPGAKNFPPVSSPGSSHGSSGSVPFVPLPVDMFAQKRENAKIDGKSDFSYGDYGSCNSDESLNLSEKPVNQKETENRENDRAEKSGRRFMRGAELNDFAELTSEVPGEDFPEMMPMRKGENRFVVGKKKDRSLTSPMYKRRAAMEQPQNSNFVPFVPFPPDYFAKKDKQPENADLAANTTSVTTTNGNMTQDNHNPLANNNDGRHNIISGTEVTNSTGATSQPNEKNNHGLFMKKAPNSGSISSEPAESKSGGYPGQGLPDVTSDSNRMIGNASTSSWSGKSLEGSAVKEPDPLDMSEEAKAERWFRRVAQIKDISELSQIPDEDFPSIMPMRKGVNRFVVSKRKTPLERRLTSQQYRRNLPIVSSDPVKSENDQEK